MNGRTTLPNFGEVFQFLNISEPKSIRNYGRVYPVRPIVLYVLRKVFSTVVPFSTPSKCPPETRGPRHSITV